jgi:hypothetical protein
MNLTHPAKWFLRCGGLMLKVEGRMELAVLRKHGASIRAPSRAAASAVLQPPPARYCAAWPTLRRERAGCGGEC